MSEVRNWLNGLGLAEYADAFERERIDLAAVHTLSDADLRELGMPMGPRKKVKAAVAALKAAEKKRSARGVDSSPDRTRGEAERRQLTVMFCDLVGSTELATRLDPEQLRDVMQAYQRACREVIERYEGHIAQYLGDGLMVYFGWPVAHEDDAVRAIHAGLEVADSVSNLRTSTPIQARVGIDTGLVVVGATGQGDASVPKAAVGETPNIAARLQGLAGPGSVVVSERTRALAEGWFDYAELGAPTLKGVSEAIRLFEAVATRAIDSRFDAPRSDVALTPLVGREEEIALLLRRWHQAKDGEGQVVLLGGEPGVGKSRLTRALREQLSPQNYAVLRYQCSPYHINSALYPAIAQFERGAGFSQEDSPEQKLDKLEAMLAGSETQIGQLAPLFAAMFSLPLERYQPLHLSPEKQKETTLEALASQVQALAQCQPMLMIYEDVHWIDATSQEFLDLLVPRLQRLPVLLIVTYRPEYRPKWTGQEHVSLLGLARLGHGEAAELVVQVTGGKVLPSELLERIVARTDGVPLFVEELTKSILESNLFREQGNRYVLESPLPALAIPATLRDSLIARLDRLAPVREVAQIGACIGREFAYDLLAAVSPLRGPKLDEALEQLTASGLLFRSGTPADAAYTFKHALVQDAAYDSLLKSKRAQLHALIAKALEKSFFERVANEPEVLAHHHTQGANLAAAIPLWRKAGELAVRRVALREAVGHLQQGLALIERLPSSSERDGLELSIRGPLHAAWVGLHGWAAPEVSVNAAAILELAERQGRPDSLAMGLYGTWINTFTQGRIAESLAWAERLLAEGNHAQDAVMSSQFFLGQLFEAREQGNRALAVYDEQRARRWIQLTGHDKRTAVGIFSSQWTWMLGYPDQAVQVSEEKDAHARRLEHAFNLGWALTFGALVFDYRREPDRLLERASEADRLAREQSLPSLYQRVVPWVEGLARLRSGMLSESISLLRRSIESSAGEHLMNPYLKSALAEALALQGDLEAGLQLIDESLEQIERPGWEERVHLAEVLRLKGWMLTRLGRGEEAGVQLRASIDLARKQQAKSWELRSSTTLARLLADRGQREAAHELLEPIYSWFTEGFDTKDLKDAKTLLEELS